MGVIKKKMKKMPKGPMPKGPIPRGPITFLYQWRNEIFMRTATKQVKKGIIKGYEIITKKEKIELSKPIGPPEELAEPFDKDELKFVAQRLFDLGYYYEKNPEKEEVEYILAPNYLGITGMASDKEQNSLQAAIKKFQRVHGFSLDKCNGEIDLDDKTLKKLNSKMVIPLRSYSNGLTNGGEKLYSFEDEDHNHLHPILWDFLDDIKWFIPKLRIWKRIRLKMDNQVKKRWSDNLANNILISYASKGYPGDGHKNPNSNHYKGKAIDIVAINGVKVSNAKKEPSILPMHEKLTPEQRKFVRGFEATQIVERLYTRPVMSFATIMDIFIRHEFAFPFKWKIIELDTPWHGDTENHQDYIHIAVRRKKLGE